MSWLDTHTSLYKCQADNTGRPVSFRRILLTEFAIPHKWFYKDQVSGKWISNAANDIDTLVSIRCMDKSLPDYNTIKRSLKDTLQCYTPSALLQTKKRGQVKEISRTGIMQLDFDYAAIADYDVEELKRAVFSLPFIGFCGLSCSGEGFYALALIAEPERLAEYAEHVFIILERYGIIADTCKGPKPENLRYVSYDSNMLIREHPEVLQVKKFAKKRQAAYHPTLPYNRNPVHGKNNALIESMLKIVRNATPGNRWAAVGKAAVTLGGTGDRSLLECIKAEIQANASFAGEHDKYNERADVVFSIGLNHPLPTTR